ncbi:hypothetical protein AB0D59_01370 [Streptomyces sp. NPDC048417]|uniref:hypothetical protein n=1 Tax=Streptomyces sp. NPDC048417 TaxID=3155387 RepID=UPI00341246CA
MAQDSWPSPAHNSRAVTDVEYELLAARFSDDGVYGSPSDVSVVSAGAGLSVDIRAGVYASVRGHLWYSGTSATNLSVGANATTSLRFDRVVLRLDRSTWNVTAVVKAGTPGSGPPDLTRDTGSTGVWEIPLATLSVAASATSVGVAAKEQYVGTRIRPCTSISLPDSPMPGEVVFQTTDQKLMLWTGELWKTLYHYSGIVACDATLAAWDISTASVLEERNGIVSLRLGSFYRAGGAFSAATESRLPVLIPAAYRHATRDQYANAYISGGTIGRVIIYSASSSDRAGQAWLTNKGVTINTGDFVLPQSGMSWVI